MLSLSAAELDGMAIAIHFGCHLGARNLDAVLELVGDYALQQEIVAGGNRLHRKDA